MASQRISASHRPPAPSPRTSVSSGSRYSKPSPHQSIRSGAPRAAPAPPAEPLRISASLRAPHPSNDRNNHPYAPEIRNSSTFFNHPRPTSHPSSKSSRLGGYHGGYHRLPPAGPPPQHLPGGPFLHPPSGANLFPPPPHPNPNHHHRDSSPHSGVSRSGTSSDSDHPIILPKRKRGKRQGWKIDLETLPATAKVGLWLMCSSPQKVARAERQQREWRAREREARWMRRHMVMVDEGRGEGEGEEEEEEEGEGDQDGDDDGDDDGEDEGEGEGKGDREGEDQGEGQGERVGARQQGAKRMSPPDMEEKEKEDWDREFARLGVKE